MLGKKQNISNGEWLEAMSKIEQTITREEIEDLTAVTIKDILISMSKG